MNKKIALNIFGIVFLGILLFLFGALIANEKETKNKNGAEKNNSEQNLLGREVQLYYYNIAKDKDLGDGEVACSTEAVLPVERQIPVTITPIQDTIRLLLNSDLSKKEKDAGFQTEFPLEGLELKGANLENGELTLEFNDPNNKTVGGSCRVNILWAQIEKTALQFEEVDQVRFIPEELFQP